MDKEKQIEELTNDLIFTNCYGTLNAVAIYLYNAGYRKQSDGEWIKTQFFARTGFYTIKEFPCNKCGEKFEVAKGNENMHFCPNCGAKMKGGTE